MTKLEMYRLNVERRYGAKLQEALSELAYHKYAMSSGDPNKAFASFLIKEGHSTTGPGGIYGITALDRWEDPTKGFVGKEVALQFGEAILKVMPRLKFLYDGPAWEINYKSCRWDADELALRNPATQKIMVKELVEDFKYIINRNKNRKYPWALGSLIFKEVRMRKEPWVRIESIFHFQPTCVGTVQCPQPRTLRGDYHQLIGNQERWKQAVKEATNELVS